MEQTHKEFNPQLKPSATSQSKRQGRLGLSCPECRRLKLRCDKMVPCSTCIRRGCASICQVTSQVAGSTEALNVQRTNQMSHRIRQLEEALASLQSTLSNEPHPLLTEELLKIKSSSVHLEGEETFTSKGLNVGEQEVRPEGGEIDISAIRDADATSFQSSEGKKQPTSASHPYNYQLPQSSQSQSGPPRLGAGGISLQQSDLVRDHSQQKLSPIFPNDISIPFSSTARLDLPSSPKRGLDEGFTSEKQKTVKQQSTAACARCRNLKMKCSFITDPKTCERCLHGGHECILPSQESDRRREQERLTNQIRSQADQMKKLLVRMESVSPPLGHMPSSEVSSMAMPQAFSSAGVKESPSYVVDSERALGEWIAKAKESFLQFESTILKSHTSKNDANLAPKQLRSSPCSRCKALKVRCEFPADSATCKRCLNGGHECVIGRRKARAAPSKRERLIHDIRTQADRINQLILKLEPVQQVTVPPGPVQQVTGAPPNSELHEPPEMSAYHAHSQSDLPDSAPASKDVNPRIEEWLLGAKQSLLQFENSLPDPGYVGDDDSDSPSWVDDGFEFSDFGPDTDADFQSSHLRKHASYSSLNTAITSVAGSIGFPTERGLAKARTSALTALSSRDPKNWRIGGDSEGGKGRRMGMGLERNFEMQSVGRPGFTTDNTPSLPLSAREDRLLAIFGQHIVDLALLNSHLKGTRPHCHSGTRENVLRKIQSCLRDTEGWDGLMFLRGAAGVGKTAILQTFAKRESEDKMTLATIFYEHEFSEQAGTFDRLVFPILAYKLALQDEAYAKVIIEMSNDHQSVLDESLQKQFDMLIAGPWARQRSEGTYVKPPLVILDGLDGHGMDKKSYFEIVRLISHYACTSTAAPERISWIISNPPQPLTVPSPLRVIDIEIPIDSDDACEDMEGFLRSAFDAICKRFSTRTPEQWPSEDDLLRVVTAASGYFAFATSIIDFVGDPSVANPVGQLDAAIAYITGRNHNISPFATLDSLYSGTLHRAEPLGLSIAMLLISLFLIPSVRFSKIPPSMVTACNILRLPQSIVSYSLSQLSTLLDIPPDDYASTCPLKLLHSSFEDFLLDPARSGAQCIKLATHKLEIQQCCTAIAQQVNGTPEKAGGLEHLQLTWCPTGSDAGEERKNVFVFAARILASLWEPELL